REAAVRAGVRNAALLRRAGCCDRQRRPPPCGEEAAAAPGQASMTYEPSRGSIFSWTP
ncbi:NSUN5 isoform 6, partial [Pan troglodytes]